MRRFGWLVLVAAAATACGSSSGGTSQTQGGVELMPGFTPTAAPDPSKGFQIITPIVKDIAPGGSYEYCTWTNYFVDKDVWINAGEGMQSETGHHVIIFYSKTKQPVGTHICTGNDMSEFNYALAPSGGQGDAKFTLPGDLAVKIPAGSQIMVNHHYLNASATNVPQAQSAINIFYADPNVPHTPAGVMAIVDSSMTIPAGVSSYGVDCTIDQTYEGWLLMPHMHAMGTHINITDTPAATGVTQQLFDTDWQPQYAFDFTGVATIKDPASPFMFQKGDKIHIQCDYNNTSGSKMTFGAEMCVMANLTVDPHNLGSMVCDRGQWGTF